MSNLVFAVSLSLFKAEDGNGRNIYVFYEKNYTLTSDKAHSLVQTERSSPVSNCLHPQIGQENCLELLIKFLLD